VNGFFNTGQSNSFGVNPGMPGVTGAILYWDSSIGNSPISTFWHSLHGTGVHLSHGIDRSFGEALLVGDNARYSGHTFILNAAYGSTSYLDWLPGSDEFPAIEATIQSAMALIAAQYPSNATYHFREIRNLGQTDIRVNSQAYQDGWAAANADWQSELATMVSAVFSAPHSWLQNMIVKTNPLTSGAVLLPTIPDQQLIAAGDTDHFIDADDLGWEADHVHMTSQGYIDLGERIGNRILTIDP